MNDIVARLDQLPASQRSLLIRTLRTDGHRYGVTPLSFAQQRMWLLNQFDPGSPAYHVSGALEIEGALDLPALEKSLAALVARHAILRSTYPNFDGQVMQCVQAQAELRLGHVDLAHIAPEPRRHATIAHAEQLRDAPFDLTRAPLLRATLLRLTPTSHWLVLCIHHIACDMVSMGIIQSELIASYAGLRAGQQAAPAPLRYQYADFAQWQRETVDSQALEKQEIYWTRKLAEYPEPLELPADRLAPTAPSLRGGCSPYQLQAPANHALSELSRRCRATSFMTLLAGYAALLHRLTGQRDIVVGSPISNRDRPEWAGVVGYFLNTLLLRVDLSGSPTFSELVHRVREVCLEAYANAQLPFEKIIDLLQPGRAMSRRPMFQALFVHQHRPAPQAVAADLVWRYIELPIRTMVADIGLWTVDSSDTLGGFVAYDADLFEQASSDRIAARFTTMMTDLLADPERRIDRAPWIPAAESVVISARNLESRIELGTEACLHELFAQQAASTPDAMAVMLDERKLSYRELDEQANALACRLQMLGIGPENRVAVMLERSPELVIALMAVLKAGGAYVPLDPAYPHERLAYMLADCNARVLLATTQSARACDAIPAATQLILLDAPLEEAVAAAPVSTTRPDHLAYVIYTSGSTGRPKGAMNEHRAIVNRLRWMQREYRLQSDDRVLQKTPASFDVSVWEFFWPLITGATLVLARPGGHRDPAYLAELIERERITTLHFVPSMFRAFLEQPGLERLTSLRRVFCSGEALTPELVQRFLTVSTAQLHNLYGPTEAAVDVTFWPCTLADRIGVPIGHPVANTAIHVLDERMQPMPIGVAGELYIGGVQVGRGYLDRPALTGERFVPDPFSRGGARLYRTGDRARRRADGAVEYLGRNDHQVKIRGLRIELGEIESVLARHPRVAATVVVDRPAPSGEPMLVAYVQARAEADDAEPQHDGERIGAWASVYDEAYAGEDADAAFDTSSWNSSYDSQPVPAPQMQAYVESRIDAIRALRPRRVLEIGCGTGLLLHRLAPDCERYVGTEISEVALAKLARAIATDAGRLGHVELLQRDALDLSGWEPGAFDTVVLNSVIQLFPGEKYLERVLDGLQSVLAPGGCIFVGDVRRLDMQRLFHTSVQQYRAASDISPTQLRERVAAAIAREQDLVVSLDLFRAWAARDPRRHVVFELERGVFHNEFTRFRCDVLLFLDRAPSEKGDTVAWTTGMTYDSLEARVESLADGLWITGLPNSRVTSAAALQAWMDADFEVSTDPGEPEQIAGGIDPHAMHELARKLGHRLSLRPARSGNLAAMDALFHPLQPSEPDCVPVGELSRSVVAPAAVLSNQALRTTDEQSLAPVLARFLRSSLPEYMVPDRFVFLDALPLSPSGKIDRGRLPALAQPTGGDRAACVPARDAVEQRLMSIWESLLGVRGFGVRDNFFELGGQSILGARLMARIRSEFERTLPLSTLFEEATIEHLANRLRQAEGGASRALVPIRASSVAGSVPLPFFCVHAGGGNVIAYRDLAANLLPANPNQLPRGFYAFQALGMDGACSPLDDFTAMARHYIGEMRSVQPQGPYFLGGWCTGGRIAHTMARQLQAQGETVAMLALLDAVSVPESLPDGEVLDDTALLASMTPAFQEAAAAAEGPDRLADMVARLCAAGLIPAEAGIAQIHDMLRVFRAILRAERRHELGRFDGPVTLFRAAEQPPGMPADLGWGRWLDPAAVRIIDVPGNHLSMVESPANAAVLARALESVLAATEQQAWKRVP